MNKKLWPPDSAMIAGGVAAYRSAERRCITDEQTVREIFHRMLLLAKPGHTRPMHVALDKKGRVQATWYHGCASTYPVWKKAIKNLGYRAVKVEVAFPW